VFGWWGGKPYVMAGTHSGGVKDNFGEPKQNVVPVGSALSSSTRLGAQQLVIEHPGRRCSGRCRNTAQHDIENGQNLDTDRIQIFHLNEIRCSRTGR
jgi:hypothetical protein